MPRGNLEMIYPRSLVISNLKRLLDNTEYGEAVVEMRRHRVDMNLIYDHNPEVSLCCRGAENVFLKLLCCEQQQSNLMGEIKIFL